MKQVGVYDIAALTESWNTKSAPAQRAFIQEICNNVLLQGASTGDIALLDFIWEKSLPVQRIPLLRRGDHNAFITAVEHAQPAAQRWLWNKNPCLYMLHAQDDKASALAAKNNDLSTLQQLCNLEPTPSLRRAMHFAALSHVTTGETIEWLWEQEPDPERRLAMLRTNNYEAFKNALKRGALPVAQWLWEQEPDPERRLTMLRANRHEVFKNTLQGAALPVVQWLWEQEPDPERRLTILRMITKYFLSHYVAKERYQ